MNNAVQQEVPVAILTKSYCFFGKLATGGRRLLDILNDSLTDYLHLRAVQVGTTLDNASAVEAIDNCVIAKQNVLLALLQVDSHEAPIKRQNYRVRRDFCEAFMVLGSVRVRGAIHLPRLSNNPTAILSRDLKSFFAVTDASISLGMAADGTLDTSVVLVNKSELLAFHVDGGA